MASKPWLGRREVSSAAWDYGGGMRPFPPTYRKMQLPGVFSENIDRTVVSFGVL